MKCWILSVCAVLPTHVVNEFSHHAVPFPLVILSPVLPVSHKLHLVSKAQDVGQLFEQVQTVALEAVIAIQWFIRFLIHDIRIFLENDKALTSVK